MKKHFLFVSFIISALLITSCTQKFKPVEYISTTGSASPGNETRIELEDGAAISIPETSIDGDISVKIERNPDKAKTLPPLPDGVIQVGDFYNFEVTNGELLGPVDITLPFDDQIIPKGNGLLTVAFPSEDGWEYIPVARKGNKVTVYTDHLGDPLIAWHFPFKNSLDYYLPEHLNYICAPVIPIHVIKETAKQSYKIVGRLAPLGKDFITSLGDQLADLILEQAEIFKRVICQFISILITSRPASSTLSQKQMALLMCFLIQAKMIHWD